MTSRLHRLVLASAFAPIMLLASNALAQSASDGIADATNIVAIPFSGVTDVSAATSTPDELSPQPCTDFPAPFEGSVWYRYTATSNGDLVADTSGSNYDTVVIVWDGLPAGGLIAGCNDDSNGVQSRARFTGQANHTYYVQIARWGFLPDPGSRLVFSLAPPPPPFAASVTVDPIGRAAGATGVIELTGSVVCNRPGFVSLVLYVDQQHGRIAAGGVFLSGFCGPQPVRAVARLVGANARFTPGPINALVAGTVQEAVGFGGDVVSIYGSTSVRLNGASAKTLFLPPPPRP